MLLRAPDGRCWSRRAFLLSCSAPALAAAPPKNSVFPSEVVRYADPSTEFIVHRFTDPANSCRLPEYYCRFVSRNRSFLVYASDRTGAQQIFQMDLKTGQNRLLTEAARLDPASVTLFPDERSVAYFDGSSLNRLWLNNRRVRRLYDVANGFEHAGAFALSADGRRAVLVEKSGDRSRLRLINVAAASAVTVYESNGLLRNPLPRPNGATILFQGSDDAWWLIDFDGRNNRRLETAPGRCVQALWSPDGRTILYLNVPSVPRELHTLREFTLAENRDRLVARTTQFVRFSQNRNASVFVCASGAKASPYIMLLLRVGRELTLCEHRASDPSRITAAFSPDSRWIFFESDRDGKPAIYGMPVTQLVEQTEL
ncbi:MAG: PD40 domain-containing protein [Bryobacteraceae bacterium]|nr:PD40 domain-containing protein [Bryobacteraceae bacterium]